MIYGKLTNGQLQIVTHINDGINYIVGINAEVAERFGLKEVVQGTPPDYQYTVSYEETDTQIVYIYTEVPPIWHDETCTIQIKLNHFDNANMLKKYPHMANYGGVLPCFIEFDYVYLYANFITEEDRLKLTEFNAQINEH